MEELKICCIADVHGFCRKIKIPSCDLIICAGDITMTGEIGMLAEFNEWLGEFKTPAIVIAGNHDLSLENNKYTAKAILNNAVYLEEDSYTFKGIKIFGSPMSPKIPTWAFGYEKDHAEMTWDLIPDDTEILITHGPPRKIMDKIKFSGKNVGCVHLLDKIKRLKNLKAHIFGHIHEARGFKEKDGVKFINASICNYPDYQDTRRPIMLNFTK